VGDHPPVVLSVKIVSCTRCVTRWGLIIPRVRDQTAAHQSVEDIWAERKRLEDIVKTRPDFGTETDVSVTRLGDGLACVTTEKSCTIETDIPEMAGGADTGPTPGVLRRAALASCLAMDYKTRAGRLGVEFTSVTVTVSTDSTPAGHLDLESDLRPGYSETRYHVEIESSATESEIDRVLNEADQLSPILDAFTNSSTTRRTVEVRRPIDRE